MSAHSVLISAIILYQVRHFCVDIFTNREGDDEGNDIRNPFCDGTSSRIKPKSLQGGPVHLMFCDERNNVPLTNWSEMIFLFVRELPCTCVFDNYYLTNDA